MFVREYRYSYDFGVVLGQGKRFSVKAIQPLSSQELTHKMLCRQSQLSAQPYRTVTENIGIIFLFCARISNFLLFRNKCNFRHRGIGLYIRPIWAYIRYINTPTPNNLLFENIEVDRITRCGEYVFCFAVSGVVCEEACLLVAVSS